MITSKTPNKQEETELMYKFLARAVTAHLRLEKDIEKLILEEFLWKLAFKNYHIF